MWDKEVKMAIHLPERIVAKTTKCHKDFACLENADEVICPVERHLGNGLLFVTPSDYIFCSYKTSFGYSSICGCPVRQELYFQHHK